MNVTSQEAANSSKPSYGSKPQKPGLYLGLFHGRRLPLEQMNDWGFDGPTIGPLKWCHTTYAFNIKIQFENSVDALNYFGVQQEQFHLDMNGDLVVVDGMYYGDWTVYYVGPDDCERPTDTFRKATRANELFAHRCAAQ
jgi:hypothetical protein